MIPQSGARVKYLDYIKVNKIEKNKEKYVAFLRGINVGGHHKVPMADLRSCLEELGCQNVVTLLNSGNIIFNSAIANIGSLEKTVAEHLESVFGFPIPTMLRRAEMIYDLLTRKPFKEETVTKDIRLYVSFLGKEVRTALELPWKSEDNSYRIISKNNTTILSVLDLSISKTPEAMKIMEQTFGKDITTRNWNTIERIGKKLDSANS